MVPVTFGHDELVKFPKNVLSGNNWNHFLTLSYYLLKTYIEIGEIEFYTAMRKIDALLAFAEKSSYLLEECGEGEEFMLQLGKITSQVGIIYSQLQAEELSVRKSHLAPLCFGSSSVAKKNYDDYVAVMKKPGGPKHILAFDEFILECSYYPLKKRKSLLSKEYASKSMIKIKSLVFCHEEINGLKILFAAYTKALNDDSNVDSWFNMFTTLRRTLLALKLDRVVIEYLPKTTSAYSTDVLKNFQYKGQQTVVSFPPTIASEVTFDQFLNM